MASVEHVVTGTPYIGFHFSPPSSRTVAEMQWPQIRVFSMSHLLGSAMNERYYLLGLFVNLHRHMTWRPYNLCERDRASSCCFIKHSSPWQAASTVAEMHFQHVQCILPTMHRTFLLVLFTCMPSHRYSSFLAVERDGALRFNLSHVQRDIHIWHGLDIWTEKDLLRPSAVYMTKSMLQISNHNRYAWFFILAATWQTSVVEPFY